MSNTLHIASKTDADERLKTYALLTSWLDIFEHTDDSHARRVAAQQIRSMARMYEWISDEIPQGAYEAIYRVRCASGTVSP